MRFKLFIFTSVILSLSLPILAETPETNPVKIYARGDYALAAQMLEQKYQQKQTSIQELIILSRAYLHLGQNDDAMNVLNSALIIDPENPEANSLAGKILNEKGKYEQALQYLKQAWQLKQDPAMAGTLGQCYYGLGQYTKAKVYLEKALEQDIRNPNNSFLLGKICLDKGFGALAEKYFLKAQEAAMDSPKLYLSLGQAYMLQRKYVGPILVRRLNKQANPGELVDDCVVLGKIEDRTNQYRLCTNHCALYEAMRLLLSQPDSNDAKYMLARSWFAAGNSALADKYLTDLLKTEQNTQRTLDIQVRLLLAAQDYKTLSNTLDHAKQAKIFDDQTIASFYYQAALMLQSQGKQKHALRMFEKAENTTPASQPILRSLAALHLGLKQHKKAKLYYGRLVELFPDAPDIDELRNTLRVLEDRAEN